MAIALESRSVLHLENLETLSRGALIDAVTEGLPSSLLRELAQRLGVTLEEMATLLRLTPRTLQRRLDDDRLDLGESERLWELSRLFFRAIEVLESEQGAVRWFHSPIRALGYSTPLNFARTSIGIRELENILGRIEHGVFS